MRRQTPAARVEPSEVVRQLKVLEKGKVPSLLEGVSVWENKVCLVD